MARLNIPGLIYLHLLIISLLSLSFLALKDMNFTSLTVVIEDISTNQAWAMAFSFVGGCVVLLVMFVHGFLIKEPRPGFFGILSLIVAILLVLALLGSILFVMAEPPEYDEDDEDEMADHDQYLSSYSYSMLAIPIASAFLLMASLIFLVIKFSDDRERRWFMLAVRQEMEHPSRIVCPVCETVVPTKARKCYKCKTKIR